MVTFVQMTKEYSARNRNADWRQMTMHWHTLPPYVEGNGGDWNRDGWISAEGDAAYAEHCDRSDVVPFLPSAEAESAGAPMATSPSQGDADGPTLGTLWGMLREAKDGEKMVAPRFRSKKGEQGFGVAARPSRLYPCQALKRTVVKTSLVIWTH